MIWEFKFLFVRFISRLSVGISLSKSADILFSYEMKEQMENDTLTFTLG